MQNNFKDRENFPDNYTVYRKDRKTGRGGGVFIAVRDDFVSAHVADFDTNCKIIWVKLDTSSCKNVYLALFYHPNVDDRANLSNLAESLNKLPKDNSHVWVAGDMNLPGFNWPSGTLKTNCPSPSQHRLFLDILADKSLVQVTDQPTGEDNVLDLLAVNNPTLINCVDVIPGIS